MFRLSDKIDLMFARRQSMIWATMLTIAACVVAWAAYAWLSKMSSTELAEFDISPSTGAVNFDYSLVEKMVRAQLPDPGSAKFGPMLAYRFRHVSGKSGTAVCGSVSVKNSSGKYDGPKEFVFISNPVSAVIDPSAPDSRFVNVWKEYCTDQR
jgi:hypothetical protein